MVKAVHFTFYSRLTTERTTATQNGIIAFLLTDLPIEGEESYRQFPRDFVQLGSVKKQLDGAMPKAVANYQFTSARVPVSRLADDRDARSTLHNSYSITF